MSFWGRSFIYDGVPSEVYGLYIANIDSETVSRSMGSTTMSIYNQKIFRKSTPYFFGASPSDVLSFKFSAFSEKELTATDFELIQKWLFSSRSFKKFQIDQNDLRDIYFNAIFNDPEIIRTAGIIRGFDCNVVCDSPHAFKFPKTIIYSWTTSNVNDIKIFNNESDDSNSYLYPILVITMNNGASGVINIINENDGNRQFSLGVDTGTISSTGNYLSANEVLTVDCGNQTLVSSTGLKRLDIFNKKFLRLVPGVNTLHIIGNVASIAMTTQYIAKKISG